MDCHKFTWWNNIIKQTLFCLSKGQNSYSEEPPFEPYIFKLFGYFYYLLAPLFVNSYGRIFSSIAVLDGVSIFVREKYFWRGLFLFW